MTTSLSSSGSDWCLVLEDGEVYYGVGASFNKEVFGEVVFSTCMTGYLEMISDPSYRGQILVLTYPLIGNYGVNLQNMQSDKVQISGLVISGLCDRPSHQKSTTTLYSYLSKNGVPNISSVDTRAIARRIRTKGVMMGAIAKFANYERVKKTLKELPRYGEKRLVPSSKQYESYDTKNGHKIALIDYGVKSEIVRLLELLGCVITALPPGSSFEAVMKTNPKGVVISPGPGDPAQLDTDLVMVKKLIQKGVPLLGICLGHQLVARALGATTYKLKFGHRGGNQPVIDLKTKRVCITSHNHGYAVDETKLPDDLEVSHKNLNDGTVEGMRHTQKPIITIQYHPEASPGPNDARYIFESFLDLLPSKKSKVST